eukprot:scaffold12806_cov104-Isochrysis_galbana.AAC.12
MGQAGRVGVSGGYEGVAHAGEGGVAGGGVGLGDRIATSAGASMPPPCAPSPQLARAAPAAPAGGVGRTCMRVCGRVAAEASCAASVASAAGRAEDRDTSPAWVGWAIDGRSVSAAARSRSTAGSSAAADWPNAAAVLGGVEQCPGVPSGCTRRVPVRSSASTAAALAAGASAPSPSEPPRRVTGRAKPTGGCNVCVPSALRVVGPATASCGGSANASGAGGREHSSVRAGAGAPASAPDASAVPFCATARPHVATPAEIRDRTTIAGSVSNSNPATVLAPAPLAAARPTAPSPAAEEDATLPIALKIAELTPSAAQVAALSSGVWPHAVAEMLPSALPLQLALIRSPSATAAAAVAEAVSSSLLGKEATTPASACETTDRAICAGPGIESAGTAAATCCKDILPPSEVAAVPSRAAALTASAAMQRASLVRVEEVVTSCASSTNREEGGESIHNLVKTSRNTTPGGVNRWSETWGCVVRCSCCLLPVCMSFVSSTISGG